MEPPSSILARILGAPELQIMPTPIAMAPSEFGTFMTEELIPLVRRLQKSKLLPKLLERLTEKIPDVLYRHIRGMATLPRLAKSPLPEEIRPSVLLDFMENPGMEAMFIEDRYFSPYIVYNPERLRVETIPHEMFHYFYNPSTFSSYGVQDLRRAANLLKNVDLDELNRLLTLDITAYTPQELVPELWSELSALKILQESGIPLPATRIPEVLPSDFLKLWEEYHNAVLGGTTLF